LSNFSLDKTLVLLYFLATLGFGFYKRSDKGINNFLFAGRKLTIPALVATLVSTWYGGILEVGRFTYENGIVTWIIFGLFYYIAAILFVKYIAPKIIESSIPTIPELFLKSFGKIPALIAIVCVILLTTPAPYLKILATLFDFVWGIPVFWALVLGSFLSIIYTVTGGFAAVVRTDKLQFVLMFLGFAVLLFSAWSKYGGISFLTANIPEFAFNIPGNFSWTFIFVWGFIALITFIDPGFYQRSFAGQSLKTVRRGILISVGFWVIFDCMTVLSGLYALAILPTVEISPYLDLANVLLPPFAKGLFLVSLFAIVMSTVDSFTFISAITIGRDLPTVLGLKLSDEKMIQLTRVGLGVTALFSICLALYFEYAVDIWYLVGSFVVPTLLIPLITGLYQIKIRNPLALLLLPPVIAICWYIYGITHPTIEGYPNYIWGLDPMYPGMAVSLVLFAVYKESKK
jgi:SSS family solute:Na+ symporter